VYMPKGNPPYPKLGETVAKFRRINNPTREQRQAHGEAVEEAFRALQRRELQRELPSFKPSCASGTWHNGGDYADGHANGKLGEAIRNQQETALRKPQFLSPSGPRNRARTDWEWREAYIEAMKEKHGLDWKMQE